MVPGNLGLKPIRQKSGAWLTHRRQKKQERSFHFPLVAYPENFVPLVHIVGHPEIFLLSICNAPWIGLMPD